MPVDWVGAAGFFIQKAGRMKSDSEIFNLFNNALLARNILEYKRLLVEYSDFLTHDNNSWVLRYSLIVSPDKEFTKLIFETCVRFNVVIYNWMI